MCVCRAPVKGVRTRWINGPACRVWRAMTPWFSMCSGSHPRTSRWGHLQFLTHPFLAHGKLQVGYKVNLILECPVPRRETQHQCSFSVVCWSVLSLWLPVHPPVPSPVALSRTTLLALVSPVALQPLRSRDKTNLLTVLLMTLLVPDLILFPCPGLGFCPPFFLPTSLGLSSHFCNCEHDSGSHKVLKHPFLSWRQINLRPLPPT